MNRNRSMSHRRWGLRHFRTLFNSTPFLVKAYPGIILFANRVSLWILEGVAKETQSVAEAQTHLAALEQVYSRRLSSLQTVVRQLHAQIEAREAEMRVVEADFAAIQQIHQRTTQAGPVVTPSAKAAIAAGVPEESVGPTDAIRDAVRDLPGAFGAKDVFVNLQKRQPALAARISRARISVILSKLVARGEISTEHGGPGKKSLYEKTATFGLKPGHKPKGETATKSS